MAHQHSTDYNDPFNAGQMVGMLVMLTFIERQGGLSEESINHLKTATANNLESYLDKPAEDIHLMIDDIVKEIQI